MDKTLGQIAHEAGEAAGGWVRKWHQMHDSQKAEWEAIAAAVAAAVKEEDARICEAKAEALTYVEDAQAGADDCAAAIRASIKEVK